MLISAVRYAIGRRTYIVSWTVSYIMPLIPDMDTKVLTIMKRDYEEAPSLGDACDKSDWDRFYDAVFTELEKRGEMGRNSIAHPIYYIYLYMRFF